MTEAEFQRRVRQALEQHEENLVPVLRQIIEYDYPPEVASVDFEVFVDGFTQGFPVRAFFMDESNSEFFVLKDGEAIYPSPVDPGLLDISRVYDDSLEEQLLAARSDADSYTLVGQALIPWFAYCWATAGGAGFLRRSGINLHDDLAVFDLVQQEWRSN